MKKLIQIFCLVFLLSSCLKGKKANNLEQKKDNEISLATANTEKVSLLDNGKYFSNIGDFKKFISVKWIALGGSEPCGSFKRTIDISNGILYEYDGMEPSECKIESIKQINSKTLEILIEDSCNYGNIFKVEILNFENRLVKWYLYNNISYEAKPYNTICKDWDKEPKKENSYYIDLYKSNNTVLEPTNEWKGLYYYESEETGKEFILDTRNNIFQLESDYFIDQLKAVQVADTLGLYHHKNLSGANYDNTRSYDFLKFYKSSDGKYYFEGKLPYLPEGAIEFEKVK